MTTIGVDYASVDGDAPPDFAAAKKAGIRFAIPRAIYGRRAKGQADNLPVFVDPTWARDKDAIRAAGLKRTAYLFLCYPKLGVATPDPEVQAQAFIDYVKLDRSVDFCPMLDVEEAAPNLSGEEMYAWTLRAVEKLRAHYGTWPGIYTSARVWAENVHGHSPGVMLNCPLWLAKPWPWPVGTMRHLDGAPGYNATTIPEFSNQWFLYQYQGDATHCPGFTSTVDMSRFRVFGKGALGAHVVWAQRRLGVKVDGNFGYETDRAVRALQTAYRLTVDGIVGADTFAVLSWIIPTAAAQSTP